MDLENEVSKLRHHVSVLSKQNHALKKEMEKNKEEEACEKVASPIGGKEPEPQGVAEPSDHVMGSVGMIVAGEEDDMWVEPVAGPRVVTPPVAESRVAEEEDEPKRAVVRLPEGKKRRLNGEEEEEKGVVEAVVPLGPRGYVAGVPRGPR